MDCDELNSELVGGSPDLSSDRRENVLATAEVVDVSLRDRVVGLDEQDLIPQLMSCRLERKRDGGQLSPVAAVPALAAREEAPGFVLFSVP